MKTKSTKTPDDVFLKFDREHIWHPYTSMIDPLPVYRVLSASGVRIRLSDGRELVDGMSSWWAAIHGYNHPVLNKAAKKQIDAMAHVMFGGLTHDPAIELAGLIVELTPDPLDRIFFCDSGSVAVEVAIKMAIQYWHSQGKPEKKKLLTIRNGYHGDTFNAMSVCDPETGMHNIFSGMLPENYFADAPKLGFYDNWDEGDIESFKILINKHHENIAAVILEPVVQGAGGMRIYSPHYVRRVRELCDELNVLLIFDEIATGFGRTGKMFACEHTGVTPDIMCLGKAVTGGYVSFAMTVTTGNVGKAISEGEPGVFMHGPTFMGNPLACSIANASIKLLMESGFEEKILKIEEQLKNELAGCLELPLVSDVRILGAIGAVELNRPVNVALAVDNFVKMGVWIRPFENVIYIMPPYIIESSEITKLTSSIYKVIKEKNC